MLRWLLIIGGLITVIVVALSFHQPPMRLMPTPQAFLGGAPNAFAANPALDRDNRIEFFYATNRLPVGPRNNRLYAIAPGRNLNFGVGSIRIGGEGTAWDKIYALSTGTSDDRRPQLNLETLTELASLDEEEAALSLAQLPAGARGWFGLLNAALERSPDKDIIIYVHGANATVERAAGQAAQLHHFTGQNSIVLLFAWPTAENFLRYPQDVETAFGAAPQLARLVKLLAQHSKARNIDIMTYSAGGTVGSAGLALVGQEARRPGARSPRLGEVYHAAPDADTRDFADDLADYVELARQVTVAANMGDLTLRISQTVNRASRAGRPDFAELSPEAQGRLLEATKVHGLELVSVRAVDFPNLSTHSHTFWYTDPWVSSDVLLTLLLHLTPAERTLVSQPHASGGRFWTFPTDYDAQLPAVLASARARASGRVAGSAAPG